MFPVPQDPLRLLLLDERLHQTLKTVFSLKISEIAALIEQPHGGNAIDPVGHREFVFPSLAIEMLWPSKLLFFDESPQRALLVVQGNSDDLKSISLIFIIDRLHFGHSPDTWPASRRPKLDQDHLSLQLGQVHF